MAHNGISRHSRHSRYMKRKLRQPAGEDEVEQGHQHNEEPTSARSHGSVIYKGDETQDGGARSDGGSLREKRQQSVEPEDQTTVLATVIDVVDQDTQTSVPGTQADTTAASIPTTAADVVSDQPATTAEPSAAVTASTAPEESPTASPGYPSPSADTPTVTTGQETLTTELPSDAGTTTIPSETSPGTVSDLPSSAPSDTPSNTSTGISSGTPSDSVSGTSMSDIPTSSPPPTQSSSLISSSVAGSSSSSIRVSSSSAIPTAITNSNSISNSTAIFNSESYSSTTTVPVTVELTTYISTEPSTSYISSTSTESSYGYGGGSTTATSTSAGQTPSATSSPGGSGALDSQTKGKIAGGVVGGVAGAVILLIVAMLLVRRRKAAAANPGNATLPAGPETGTAVGAESVTRGDMASRSSNDPLFTASYFAPAFMKRWRQSNQTTRTDSTLIDSTSERGFQKIAGRKIPSVLQSGGDGYGGGFEATSPTASEPSTIFTPPSPVHPRSPTSQPPPSVPYGMPLDTSYTREAEESEPRVVFRPSPARTPVAGSSASLNDPAGSRKSTIPQLSGALSPTMPKRPDLLGRSHPSFDGSRGSRFSENL